MPIWLTTWDREAFFAINHGLKCGPLDRVMPWITDLGLGGLQAACVLGLAMLLGAVAGQVRGRALLADLWAAIRARRQWVSPLLAAFAISGLGADAIKAMVPRNRPWWFYELEHQAGHYLDVHVYTVPGVYPLKVHGFPSGHTATTVALAMVVTLLFARAAGRRWLVMSAWLVALSVAISRMYLGSHWPLDVLGGAVVGVVSGWAAVTLCRAYARRHAPADASRGPSAAGDATR